MRNVVLAIHVACGGVGLLLGPPAMRAVLEGRRRTALGSSYHWAVLIVCTSAVGLAAFDWSNLWFFVPIAIASYAFALVAQLAPRRDMPDWRPAAVRGVGGSYIALWTALLVVSTPALPVLWFAPTAIGAPIIERISHRVGRLAPRVRADAPMHDQ